MEGSLVVFTTLLALSVSEIYDPTKICTTRQLEFQSYNMDTGEMAVISLDFDRNMGAWNYTTRGFRLEDFKNMKKYEVDPSGSCKSYDMPYVTIEQCLPATATFVGSGTLGFAPYGVLAESFTIQLTSTKTIGYTVTVQDNMPSFPMLALHFGDDQHTDFLFNHSTTISDPGVFKIPSPCPPGP